MRKKVKLFITAAIASALIFGSIGILVLGLPSNPSPAPMATDTYNPPPDPDTLLLIRIEAEEEPSLYLALAFRFSENTVHTVFMPGNTLLPGYAIAEDMPNSAVSEILASAMGITDHRYISIHKDKFIPFIDNFNGAIYTENNQTQYVIMGEDFLNLAKEQPQMFAEVLADFAAKLLFEIPANKLSDGLSHLFNNGSGNFSYVDYAAYRDELQALLQGGRVMPMSADYLLNSQPKE